jgi:hypothetical protein
VKLRSVRTLALSILSSLHLPDTSAPIEEIDRLDRHSLGNMADALITNSADIDCVIYRSYLYRINSWSNLDNVAQIVGVASHERGSPILVIADRYRISRFERIVMAKLPDTWDLGWA